MENGIITHLPSFLSDKITFLPEGITEIRIRENRPVAVTVLNKTLFLNKNGSFSEILTGDEIIPDSAETEECFLKLCNYSVFAHEEEIKEGYISLKNGCRVGVAGDFGSVGSGRITSLNIRFPRCVAGCADALRHSFMGGLLIAGPPLSGKTTVLRELCRLLSSGETGVFYRVAVIDARNELEFGGSLGVTADILKTRDKAKGAEIALRTLSPQIIAFDEIGSSNELKSVSDCFNAGVTVITTAHAGGITDLLSRSVTESLLKSGAIKNIALLSGKIEQSPKLFKTDEVLNDF